MMTTNKLSSKQQTVVDAGFHGYNVIPQFSAFQPDGYYKLDGERRILLIFNHNFFDDCPHEHSVGAKEDADLVKSTFSQFGFETIAYTNLTFGEIFSKLLEWRSRDLTDVDCFVTVVMTHTEKGNTLCAKDYAYMTSTLWNEIKKNSTLNNKPKIFLIQVLTYNTTLACSGVPLDDFIQADVGANITLKHRSNGSALTVNPSSMPDMLVAQITVHGGVSYRINYGSSIFIRELCKQLRKADFEQTDFAEVIERVSKDVANYYESSDNEFAKLSKRKHTFTFLKTLKHGIRFPKVHHYPLVLNIK